MAENPRQPQHIESAHICLPFHFWHKRWEEFYYIVTTYYIFPDEQETQPNLKILEMAHKWERQKADDAE
jgi:hypothetical protein